MRQLVLGQVELVHLTQQNKGRLLDGLDSVATERKPPDGQRRQRQQLAEAVVAEVDVHGGDQRVLRPVRVQRQLRLLLDRTVDDEGTRFQGTASAQVADCGGVRILRVEDGSGLGGRSDQRGPAFRQRRRRFFVGALNVVFDDRILWDVVVFFGAHFQFVPFFSLVVFFCASECSKLVGVSSRFIHA